MKTARLKRKISEILGVGIGKAHKPKRRYIGIGDLIIPALSLVIALGAVAGFIWAFLLGEPEYSRLNANIALAGLIQNAGQMQKETFFEALIKYGKIPLVIWFSAFIPPGALISVVLLFVKGTGLGFALGLYVRCFGLTGVLYSVILYCTQNFFIIPAYIYLSHASLNFAAGSMRALNGGQRKPKTKTSRPIPSPRPNRYFSFLSVLAHTASGNRILEYSFSLIVSLSCAMLAALIEAYCVPGFLQFLV